MYCAHLFVPLHPQMKKFIVILVVVAGLAACGSRRQKEVEQFRMKVRSEFLKEKLEKAQQELALTDSIMQARGGEVDSTPGYLDSLEMAAENCLPLHRIMANNEAKTNEEFEQTLTECRTLFEKKLHDYGASWRILRPQSLTDQLFIKAKRIRSLEIKKESLVGEGIRPEFIALINYGIVGLIQLYHGFSDTVDMDNDAAMVLYDKYAQEALELMKRKNHDYDEAWRGMRVSSYTDFILTKIERIKEIENLGGETLVSEGIDANYMDIINYAVFGAIKLRS